MPRDSLLFVSNLSYTKEAGYFDCGREHEVAAPHLVSVRRMAVPT